MSVGNAERIFGKTCNHVRDGIEWEPAQLQEKLRGLVADHHMMIETGMDVTIALNPKAVHNLLAAHEARIAASGGRPRNSPLTALPSCDRWGDTGAPIFMSASKRLHTSDVLAHSCRATLPMATRMAPSGHRTGPGASTSIEFESSYQPVCTYAELSRGGVVNPAVGRTGDCGEDVADTKALHLDAERAWPPRVLGAAFDSGKVTAAVRSMCDALDDQPERTRRTNGPGTYTKLFKRAMATLDDASARDLLSLRIGAFEREPLELHRARRCAMHASMAAHACSHSELGVQLERIGDAISGLGRG